MPDNKDVEIARIDERLKAHALMTTQQFAQQNVLIGQMMVKLDIVTNAMNRGKGAFAASMIVAGAIGSGIMGLITWIKHG